MLSKFSADLSVWLAFFITSDDSIARIKQKTWNEWSPLEADIAAFLYPFLDSMLLNISVFNAKECHFVYFWLATIVTTVTVLLRYGHFSDICWGCQNSVGMIYTSVLSPQILRGTMFLTWFTPMADSNKSKHIIHWI